MILRKLTAQRISLEAGLYAAFSVSFWFAFWLRFYSNWIPRELGFRSSDYVVLYAVALVTWGAFTRLLQLDHLWTASEAVPWMKNCTWATLGTLMLVSFGTFFVRAYSFSRVFMLLFGALNLIALAAARSILLMLARREFKRGEEIRVLVVGDAVRAEEISETLTNNSWVCCRAIGYLAVDGETRAGGVPRLGRLEDLEAACRQHRPNEILVAVPLLQLSRVADFKKALSRVAVPSRLVCDFLKEVGAGGALHNFFSMTVMDLHRNPGDSLVYGVLKRSFDLIVSLALLLALMPLLVVIALLVKLTSPGPVFFSQKRVGLHGKSFTIHKFRTMRAQSQEDSDVTWTALADQRCTFLGNYLRRLGLDELPQVWNVVRGDMSLVGPRPERPFFVDKFAEEIESYNVRHFLKSGITGWAQVHGLRGDTSIAERVEYDLYYLTHWSFTMDLKILWLTLWKGFRGQNAH